VSPEELAAFEAAGPARPVVDPSLFLKARTPRGPYRVVAGDVLELRVRVGGGYSEPGGQVASAPGANPHRARSNPAEQVKAGTRGVGKRVVAGDVLELRISGVLRAVHDGSPDKAAPYVCRVSETGTIWLPIVGDAPAAGKSLGELEAAVVAAYFPKYVRTRPAVVARVRQHRTFPVSVVGAVKAPGRYDLRSDEMSLIPLLAKAGGIAREGVSAIQIRRLGETNPRLVPVRGRDSPAADVELKSGDTVQVEPGLFADEAHTCRVSDDGTIQLPVVGAIRVSGMTLAEVESAAAAAYFPKYAATRPPVVARVAEHRTATVSVVGGVEKAGRYELRSDEMSLVSLLMKAGGIVSDGARVIRIRHADQPHDAKPLVVPVKDLNVPLVDAPLQDGDAVEVEWLKPQVFTVVGLVNRPGTFPYPPGVRYTLQQALAFSAGIDPLAEPPCATIYRQDADGKILTGRFRLGGTALGEAAGVRVRPGDVIAVEHTLGTRWRLFFRRLFRVGVYASYPISAGR